MNQMKNEDLNLESVTDEERAEAARLASALDGDSLDADPECLAAVHVLRAAGPARTLPDEVARRRLRKELVTQASAGVHGQRSSGGWIAVGRWRVPARPAQLGIAAAVALAALLPLALVRETNAPSADLLAAREAALAVREAEARAAVARVALGGDDDEERRLARLLTDDRLSRSWDALRAQRLERIVTQSSPGSGPSAVSPTPGGRS